MESGSTSYCVYVPGSPSPSRPPLRRAAPEHARSGFPFLIGMAALVLAVGIGSVARFCPQDLRFETGGRHPAKGTPTSAAAITADANSVGPASAAPVITPTAFTTVGSPATMPTVTTVSTTTASTTPKKKSARRSAVTPVASASAAAASSANAAPALPENPYPQASPPETYGF